MSARAPPLLDTLIGHEKAVVAAALDPEEELIFSASEDRQVGIWKKHENRYANEFMLKVGCSSLTAYCLPVWHQSSTDCYPLEPSNALDDRRARHGRGQDLSLP